MDFRVFDFLFVVIIALAVAVAVAAVTLIDNQYVGALVTAFAAGAVTFLYFTIRVKIAKTAETLTRNLEDQAGETAKHRAALEESFANIESLTTVMREQLGAAAERSRVDIETLRKNVNGVLNQFTIQLERLTAAEASLRSEYERSTAATDLRMENTEREYAAFRSQLEGLRKDVHAFITDEHNFRDTIQNRLAERVTYLEDFIREKRKSLQI